jgi:hypothetical protein
MRLNWRLQLTAPLGAIGGLHVPQVSGRTLAGLQRTVNHELQASTLRRRSHLDDVPDKGIAHKADEHEGEDEDR